MKVELCKQFSVFLENRAGALAEVCRIIAREKINLHAICAIDTIEEAVLRMVPERGPEAKQALNKAGFRVIESDVILVELDNSPGATGDMATMLSTADINIDYVYASANSGCNKATLVLRVHQIEETMAALKGGQS